MAINFEDVYPEFTGAFTKLIRIIQDNPNEYGVVEFRGGWFPRGALQRWQTTGNVGVPQVSPTQLGAHLMVALACVSLVLRARGVSDSSIRRGMLLARQVCLMQDIGNTVARWEANCVDIPKDMHHTELHLFFALDLITGAMSHKPTHPGANRGTLH